MLKRIRDERIELLLEHLDVEGPWMHAAQGEPPCEWTSFFSLPFDPATECSKHTLHAIHLAAAAGDADAVHALGDHYGRAVVGVKGGCQERMPLLAALRYGHLELARWLWTHMVSEERAYCTHDAVSMLRVALRSERADIFSWVFVERDVYPDMRDIVDGDRGTVFKTLHKMIVVLDDNNTEPARLASVLLTRCPWFASMALLVAAAHAWKGVLARLCAMGATLGADDMDWAAVFFAPDVFTKLLRLLLEMRVPMTFPPDVVRHAVRTTNVELLQLFIEHGAPIDAYAVWALCVESASDNAVIMVRMLLERAGASPFAYDKRGVRLLDVLWARRYWATRTTLSHINVVVDDNLWRLRALVRRAMCRWTPVRHPLFPIPFRTTVRTLLLCNNRMGVRRLPRDLLHVLCQWLAVAEADDPRTLERSLATLTCNGLRDVLEDNDVTPVRKGARKQVLLDAVVTAKHEVDGSIRRVWEAARTLPAIIGRLVCTDTRTGDVAVAIDIARPTEERPWINVGRLFVKRDKASAPLDMDLAHIEFNRRISRLHVTVRFNVQTRTWQARVHGRNGIDVDVGHIDGPHHYAPASRWIDVPRLAFLMPFASLAFQIVDMSKSQ